MDEGSPRASIALYAGRELLFGHDPARDDYRLRADHAVVARLSRDPGSAETADGRWWLRNPHGVEVDAGREGSGDVLARYRPRVLGGGSVRLVSGARYTMRPPMLGTVVSLRRARSLRPLAQVVRHGSYDVTLDEGAASEPDLALILVVALQALLLEDSMPHAGGGVPAASGF